MKTKLYLYLILINIFLLASCVKDEIYVDPDAKPVAESVLVINEVASNNGDPNPDWIEIYNPSSSEIDISGYGVYDKPSAIYRFPAGTKVPAKGYFAIVCDVALAATDATKYAGFGISSGGEAVSLVDANGAIIDVVSVPAMPLGVSYSRIPDGGKTWSNSNPTKAAANSNTNEAPVITAVPITGITDNSEFEYIVSASDAGGMRDVKLYIENGSDIKFVEMAPTSDGRYKYIIPAMLGGSTLKYFVVATDETGKKSYYPTTAPATPANVIISNFLSFEIVNGDLADLKQIDFAVSIYNKAIVDEVSLFYVIKPSGGNFGATQEIKLTYDVVDERWIGTIPGQAEKTEIRYYVKAVKNSTSTVSYNPIETLTGSFKRNEILTWPKLMIAPLPNWSALVLNEVCGSQTPDDDWIEIYNASDEEVDMSGVKLIKDGASTIYTAPAGTKIAARSYIVVSTIADEGAGKLTAGISNTKNVKLELKNPKDAVLSFFEKTATLPNTAGHATNGSYARIPNATGDWTVVTAHTRKAANN